MKYKLENVSSEEQSYLYTPAENDPHSKSRIGYLRGDFGHDGDEFWHTWFPCQEELNVSEFKVDLDAVINWLRSNGDNALLKDRITMDAICKLYPENHMENQWHAEWYCFKIVTEKYTYYLRCFTGVGDYNFYLFCYLRPTEKDVGPAENAEKEFVSYHVGQVFDKKIGGDGGRFELIGRMGHINIGFMDMTEEEISVINSGKLDIYLSLIENIAFITAVFDNRLILDMPFHAGLYPEFNIENPMNHGYFVPIIAVDNRDNVIKAIRVVGLDPDFSAKLYSIALSQCKCKPVEYDHQLQRIYQRYTQEGIIRRAIRRNKVEGEK